jgi:hypothetical protein
MGAEPYTVRPVYPNSLEIDWNNPGGVMLRWINPTLYTNGNPITQRTITLHVYRNDVLVATLPNQVPGAAAFWQEMVGSAIPPRYRVSANTNVTAIEGLYAFTNKPTLQTANVEAIPYDWVEIYGTNNTGITGDNETAGPFPIGFNFPYYGQSYDNLYICSNGFASFTSQSTEPNNIPIPWPTEPNNLLAVLWDDLMMTPNSNIWYQWDFTYGRFIVEWNKPVSWMLPQASQKFEMFLWNNGYIDFIYQNVVNPTLTSCTVGVENLSGDIGVPVTYNGTGVFMPYSGKAIRIYTVPQNGLMDYAIGSCTECAPATNLAAAPVTTDLVSVSPNPFNPVTTLNYTLQTTGPVSLKVYDTNGRLVATLVEGALAAGSYQATFDGSRLASGVYLYRLQAGTQTATGKLMLMK